LKRRSKKRRRSCPEAAGIRATAKLSEICLKATAKQKHILDTMDPVTS